MQDVTKSTIAKLLATENITVVQDNVRTASFDVKHRILTLPMWADIATSTQDHLIGHEVGHALYTPLDGWHDATCGNGPAFKTFLNVIEDARIEKLIQRKYPGLRGPFIKSYRKMMADGFFGADINEVNKMPLIDRINVYFKCGLTSGVRFTTEEKAWLPRIDALETWDEVVALVEELYGEAKKELEKQKEEQEDGNDDMDLDDLEGADGEMSDNMESGEQGQEENASSDETENGEFDDSYDQEASTGPEGAGPTEPVSQTDQNLRDKIEEELTEPTNGQVLNYVLETPDWKDKVLPYKEVFKRNRKDLWPEVIPEIEHEAPIHYKEWQRVNKKAVNHMVKEFEMRKSAAEYARANISKTGVIDTVKMNNYKMTDDIFKRVTILPEGKNHGFIMYLDMSGSMANYMYETVEQLLTLVHFARQINVPFRVYGFTNVIHRDRDIDWETEKAAREKRHIARGGYHGVAFAEEVNLLELFTDKMSRADMTRMSQELLFSYAHNINAKRWMKEFRPLLGRQTRSYNRLPAFQLGGTPLDHALVIGMPLAQEFRTANRIDILNTILLTDGCSHTLDTTGGSRGLRPYGKEYCTVTNKMNNKTYRIKHQTERNGLCTDILLEMYKDITGSKVIGYFIERQTQSAFENAHIMMTGRRSSVNYDDKEKIKQFRAQGWFKVERPVGYTECYIISDRSLTIVDSTMEDLRSDASKARIRTAFKKSQGGSKGSRKMATDLIQRLA